MTDPAPTPLNRIRAMHASGVPSFGLIATIPSAQTVQILARSGLDWLLIDMEHGPIEHPDAVRNIDAIMSTPGADLAFIGPGDLATALELPNQFDHPRVKAAIAEAEAGILRSGVPLGGGARTPEQAKQMIDRGYRSIGPEFDWMLLQQAAGGFITESRKLIGNP